jgi:hypothetical protein
LIRAPVFCEQAIYTLAFLLTSHTKLVNGNAKMIKPWRYMCGWNFHYTTHYIFFEVVRVKANEWKPQFNVGYETEGGSSTPNIP